MTLLCLSWPRDATTSWSVERGKECWTTGAWTLSTLPTGLPASPSLHLFAKRRITQSRHKGEQLAESNKRKPATVLYHAFKDKGDGQFNDERLSTINTYYISSHLLRLKLAKAYLVAWFTVGPGNSVHSSPREARTPSRLYQISRDLPTDQGSCFGNSNWAGTTRWLSENDKIDDTCATDKQVALCVARQRSPCHWLRPKLSQFALFWTANCMTFQLGISTTFLDWLRRW